MAKKVQSVLQLVLMGAKIANKLLNSAGHVLSGINALVSGATEKKQDPRSYLRCIGGRKLVEGTKHTDLLLQKSQEFFSFSMRVPIPLTCGLPVTITVSVSGSVQVQLERGTCRLKALYEEWEEEEKDCWWWFEWYRAGRAAEVCAVVDDALQQFEK